MEFIDFAKIAIFVGLGFGGLFIAGGVSIALHRIEEDRKKRDQDRTYQKIKALIFYRTNSVQLMAKRGELY